MTVSAKNLQIVEYGSTSSGPRYDVIAFIFLFLQFANGARIALLAEFVINVRLRKQPLVRITPYYFIDDGINYVDQFFLK